MDPVNNMLDDGSASDIEILNQTLFHLNDEKSNFFIQSDTSSSILLKLLCETQDNKLEPRFTFDSVAESNSDFSFSTDEKDHKIEKRYVASYLTCFLEYWFK